ncbi:MAG TPA: sulfotransferase [Rhodanobacter sp.]|nr:sulfotransferase [Rhodanobacter sp.]
MKSRLDGLSPNAIKALQASAHALDAGRADEAEQQLSAILGRERNHPEILRMRAGILGMHGDHRQAVALMQQAVAAVPADPVYFNTLGTLLGQAGDYDGAIRALEQACTLQPTLAMGWYNLGVMLVRSVRNDEAVRALNRAVALESGHVLARSLLADLLRTRGSHREAAAEYRRVVARKPTAGMAWWGLADLRGETFDEADIASMHTALTLPAASDDDLIAIGFALARAYDQHGRYAESLDALARANALARRRGQWNRDGFSTAVKLLNKSFDPMPTGAPETLGHEAIFIVGLPRSGSTLVEQILASHSMVEGAGELADLPQVLAEESRRRNVPFPKWVSTASPDDWERLGQRYLERTAHWRRERPLFTDKLPGNWIYIGAIRAMLPGAHIIGCCRDALETCFSCYRQRLDNNEYTRDFDDLASYWRDCDHSLRHWHKDFPDNMFLHDHEALLRSPEQRIRELLSFCALPFEETCVRFHENRREVRSPSATQVRQPLRRETSHAPAYGSLLDPLRRALGMPPWQG